MTKMSTPWNACPKCGELVDVDDVFDGSLVECLGCKEEYTCVAYTDGSWMIHELADVDELLGEI